MTRFRWVLLVLFLLGVVLLVMSHSREVDEPSRNSRTERHRAVIEPLRRPPETGSVPVHSDPPLKDPHHEKPKAPRAGGDAAAETAHEEFGGHVIGEDGPVADAHVLMRPPGFFTKASAMVEVRADREGRFEFTIPHAAPPYVLYAVDPRSGSAGEVVVEAADLEQDRLTLTMKPIVYQRYLLIDHAGNPVPSFEHEAVVGSQPFEVLTSYPQLSLPEGRHLLKSLGFREHVPEMNEVSAIYIKESIPASFVLDLAGFKPRMVNVVERPLSEWPRSTTVRLEHDPDEKRVLHRVVFPDSESLPPEFPDVFLCYSIGEFTMPLSPKRPIFWALPDEPVKIMLGLEALQPLVCSFEFEDGVRVIRPEYPEFGFVEFRRSAEVPPDAEGMLWSIAVNGYPFVRSVVFGGRRIVVGPLPVGEYLFTATSTMRVGDERTNVKVDIGPLSVGRGVNRYAWR